MRMVVALGGNALGNHAKEQKELVKGTASALIDLVEEGHELIVAHGNGPQVGMINLAMEVAGEDMPFPECGAMSQGYIGYHLQNALREELFRRNIPKDTVTLITQVIVDEKDPAFQNPSKPIGKFYTKEEAERLEKEKGYRMKEDAGRGYRRVVASPKPVDIVEKEVIRSLVDQGTLVIAVGGGGIPVLEKNGKLEGVAAVIDKDFASAKLAQILQADVLCILTAVDRVMVNYATPEQKEIVSMDVEEAKRYIEEKQFAAGSMLPKVQAALSFVADYSERTSIIASLQHAKLALKGESGTKILWKKRR